jgi:hypothetical protein
VQKTYDNGAPLEFIGDHRDKQFTFNVDCGEVAEYDTAFYYSSHHHLKTYLSV